MKLELKKARYENMKLVKIYYGNDNPAQSLQATESMLQAYPNLKGIESPTTVGISSAAQFLSNSKKYKGKIVLTGLGLPSQMKKYVYNNTVKELRSGTPAPRLSRRLRRFGDSRREDLGQGRPDVHGRQAREVHDHQGRRQEAPGDPRTPVRLQQEERREVQLLDRGARGAAVAAPRAFS